MRKKRREPYSYKLADMSCLVKKALENERKMNMENYTCCAKKIVMTNEERIRNMTTEELAWELMTWRCEATAKYHGVSSDYPETQAEILEWLKQPREVYEECSATPVMDKGAAHASD